MKKTAIGLEVYKRLKDEFLNERKSARTIAVENDWTGPQSLSFLRWIAREFEVERSIRVDQMVCELATAMQHLAEQLVQAASAANADEVTKIRGELDKLHTLFVNANRENLSYLAAKKAVAKRPPAKDPPDGETPEPEDEDAQESAFDRAVIEGQSGSRRQVSRR